MTRSTDITSFSDHRKRLREHLDQCRQSGRPIFITSNGETAGVLLSPQAYDALAERAELAESLTALDRSMEDVASGRVFTAKDGLRTIADELGVDLDR